MSKDKMENPSKDAEDISFNYNYRNAGFFSRRFFNYAWPLISKVRDNNHSMEEKYLEDMSLEEGET